MEVKNVFKKAVKATSLSFFVLHVAFLYNGKKMSADMQVS